MTVLGKALFSLLLVGAGFIVASVFGPPELADKLADQLTPGQPVPWGDLRPANSPSGQPTVFARSEVDRLGLTAPTLQPIAQAPEFAPTPAMLPPWGLESTAPLPQLGIASGESLSAEPYFANKPATPAIPVAYNDWQTPKQPATPATEPIRDGLVPVGDRAVKPAIASSWVRESAPEAGPSTLGTDFMAPGRAGFLTSQAPAEWSGASPSIDSSTAAPSAAAPPLYGAPPAVRSEERWPTPDPSPWKQPPTPARGAPAIGAWESAALEQSSAPPEPSTWPSDAPAKVVMAPVAAPSAEQTTRVHVVSDGDTLARLASRYLGDASRSAEIYARNREVLSHPDLLPIGAELQIGGAAVASETGPQSTAGLISIEHAGQPVSRVPRARLLGPQPVGPTDAYAGW